jgi:hypothetical protein
MPTEAMPDRNKSSGTIPPADAALTISLICFGVGY